MKGAPTRFQETSTYAGIMPDLRSIYKNDFVAEKRRNYVNVNLAPAFKQRFPQAKRLPSRAASPDPINSQIGRLDLFGENSVNFPAGWVLEGSHRLHDRVALARGQKAVRVQAVLPGIQVIVSAAQRIERLMGAVLHNLPGLHH
jgi:hypothetical protein